MQDSSWWCPKRGDLCRMLQHCHIKYNTVVKVSCSVQCIKQDNVHITLKITYCHYASVVKSVKMSALLLHKTQRACGSLALCFASSCGGGIHVRFCQKFIFHPRIILFGLSEDEVRKRCCCCRAAKSCRPLPFLKEKKGVFSSRLRVGGVMASPHITNFLAPLHFIFWLWGFFSRWLYTVVHGMAVIITLALRRYYLQFYTTED